jgi:glycosyltransferase involved in cell wall biosynthesis
VKNSKRVIFGAAHPFNSPYKVGSHHYARCFKEHGWDVAYLSGPISPFHWIYNFLSSGKDRFYLKERAFNWKKGGLWIDGVWTYVPFTFSPAYNFPFFRSKAALYLLDKLMFPPIITKLSDAGFEAADLIWLDSPLYGFLTDKIQHKKSILRIADDLAGFREFGRNLLDNEKKLAHKVDAVVVTSRILEDKAKKYGAKHIVYLPNGVEIEHFTGKTYDMPEEFESIPSPRIIYVGAIESWFDCDLVEYIANNRRGLSFIIIGPVSNKRLFELLNISNIHIFGIRDYETIPAYLWHSNAAIIPFKVNSLINAVNPIKLYEYMACRLPVVCTKWKTVEDMASPAFLAEDRQQFLEMIDKALALDEKGKDGLADFARNNTWEKRFKIVSDFLENG